MLALEPLIRAVKGDKVVQGFVVPGSGGLSVKCCAYMDDVVFVCENDYELQRVNLHLRIFCSVSGMAVNWSKCNVCVLGKPVSVRADGMNKVERVKILGIYFDKNQNGSQNFVEIKNKISQVLGLWSLRSLSLKGKTLIVKTYILPLILHVSNIFPPSKVWITSITRKLFIFFWGVKC